MKKGDTTMFFPISITTASTTGLREYVRENTSLFSSPTYWYLKITEPLFENTSGEVKVDVLGFRDTMKAIFNSFNSMPFPKYRLYVNEATQEAYVDFALAGYFTDDITVTRKPYEGSKDQHMIWVSIKEADVPYGKGYEHVSSTMKTGKVAFGFVLPKYMEVRSVKYEDGLLKFDLKMNPPEELKEVQLKVE
ncbi:MAG: hypothetical protein N3A54_00825 [Patescibacteria group bacterium]|nr:hypothetical protein [Patescibacteria group bacterium]